MKKCPECGNPSYDGAPVCGNCGYKFPKPKSIAPKKETKIFKEKESKKDIKEKPSKDESTIQILKDNKILIGIIIIVTIIAICGIVLSGNNNTTNSTPENMETFTEAGFSFNYPTSWEIIKGQDKYHDTAVFFDVGENTIVEFYNVTSDYTSLKEINQDRITKAQNDGDYVTTVETITIDERNSSNIVIEESDGDYIRYVSIFTEGKLYVYKITGSSLNSINSAEINDVIASSHIS